MANEKRLIDANAFRQSLEVDRFGYTDIVKVNIAIDKSTVDAVEVVRCKDCTYWDKAVVNKKGFLICPASGMEIQADDYCSYGGRRTDG